MHRKQHVTCFDFWSVIFALIFCCGWQLTEIYFIITRLTYIAKLYPIKVTPEELENYKMAVREIQQPLATSPSPQTYQYQMPSLDRPPPFVSTNNNYSWNTYQTRQSPSPQSDFTVNFTTTPSDEVPINGSEYSDSLEPQFICNNCNPTEKKYRELHDKVNELEKAIKNLEGENTRLLVTWMKLKNMKNGIDNKLLVSSASAHLPPQPEPSRVKSHPHQLSAPTQQVMPSSQLQSSLNMSPRHSTQQYSSQSPSQHHPLQHLVPQHPTLPQHPTVPQHPQAPQYSTTPSWMPSNDQELMPPPPPVQQ